jgi:hypothetical protein
MRKAGDLPRDLFDLVPVGGGDGGGQSDLVHRSLRGVVAEPSAQQRYPTATANPRTDPDGPDGAARLAPKPAGLRSRVQAVSLDQRVARVAEKALADRRFVTPIDVLTGLGWLHQVHLDPWRLRRVDNLEQLVQVGPEKVALAMGILRDWATARGLEPSEAEYLARSRDRRRLRFSIAGDEAVERAFRTHWLSPELTGAERARLSERADRRPELVVIWPLKDFTCSICGTQSSGLLVMEDAGPVCMECAEMDHLVFLAAGDAALTRRAKAASRLWAVVVRFSRSRRRYERQGILVEEDAIELAVAASVRHRETPYEELLMSGLDREAARAAVGDHVLRTLDAWRS